MSWTRCGRGCDRCKDHGPFIGRGCDHHKDHGPFIGRGCDRCKDHEIVSGFDMFVIRKLSRSKSSPRDDYHKSMGTAYWIYCCIVINWLIVMILFVIMFMLVVSLQVHSMY